MYVRQIHDISYTWVYVFNLDAIAFLESPPGKLILHLDITETCPLRRPGKVGYAWCFAGTTRWERGFKCFRRFQSPQILLTKFPNES